MLATVPAMEAAAVWYAQADADRDAAARLIERLAERLGIPTPPIHGDDEPGKQATFVLPPQRERIEAALDDLDRDWRRLIG
jgi:hypothetical protein